MIDNKIERRTAIRVPPSPNLINSRLTNSSFGALGLPSGGVPPDRDEEEADDEEGEEQEQGDGAAAARGVGNGAAAERGGDNATPPPGTHRQQTLQELLKISWQRTTPRARFPPITLSASRYGSA